ncbi:hypothetical protein GCM10009531_16890 [Actinoplanes capillaceus]
MVGGVYVGIVVGRVAGAAPDAGVAALNRGRGGLVGSAWGGAPQEALSSSAPTTRGR